MIEKEVIILNNKGIQSRVASSLVKKAMGFKSKINITYGNMIADAKSLINVIALKVPQNTTLTITANGDDEVLAVDNLVTLLTSLE